ncbi:hypothetical protein [Streptomyces shenzhenensis]|uniref:Uncharacterized protein n=1 Tax=Streptomyces sp. R39 TaxID=3238631 RepID=A0AB39QG56_9ACTN|nr:hypothetical protein [Streptomyces shenzhenensis]
MSTTEPEASRSPDDRTTPDSLLHSAPGTGVAPEDLVMASGRDITPATLEWARKKMEREGPNCIERLLP